METKQNNKPDQGRIDVSSSSRSNRYIPIDRRKIYRVIFQPEADQITNCGDRANKRGASSAYFRKSLFSWMSDFSIIREVMPHIEGSVPKQKNRPKILLDTNGEKPKK